MPSTDLLRAWVADRVTELEGLRDDVLIDMVMRRIEEDSDWDRQSFEASVSILMGERAQGFTAALWTFLGRNDDGTSQGVPPPSTVERARPTAAPLPQSVLDGGGGRGGGQGGGGSVVGPQQPQATGGGGRGGYQDGEGEGQEEEEHYEDEGVDFEEADDYDDPRYGEEDDEEGEEEGEEYYNEEYADEAVANGDALPTPPGGGDAASMPPAAPRSKLDQPLHAKLDQPTWQANGAPIGGGGGDEGEGGDKGGGPLLNGGIARLSGGVGVEAPLLYPPTWPTTPFIPAHADLLPPALAPAVAAAGGGSSGGSGGGSAGGLAPPRAGDDAAAAAALKPDPTTL
eukprot:jgi/Chrpa1/24003/Chrysochromulina_OHIO_Genome00026583-RA